LFLALVLIGSATPLHASLVECLASGLDADLLEHGAPPVVLERVATHEGLRH
jgi:hypothetical protein